MGLVVGVPGENSADDAADLVADLPPGTAQTLLALTEPDEAEDVRRLMLCAEETAGGTRRLLREPPSPLVAGAVDTGIGPLIPLGPGPSAAASSDRRPRGARAISRSCRRG